MIFCVCVFFFNDTATTEIYTLSLHDALPICAQRARANPDQDHSLPGSAADIGEGLQEEYGVLARDQRADTEEHLRSEEHTSELQSQSNLVCRLLLEKKKTYYTTPARVRDGSG